MISLDVKRRHVTSQEVTRPPKQAAVRNREPGNKFPLRGSPLENGSVYIIPTISSPCSSKISNIKPFVIRAFPFSDRPPLASKKASLGPLLSILSYFFPPSFKVKNLFVLMGPLLGLLSIHAFSCIFGGFYGLISTMTVTNAFIKGTKNSTKPLWMRIFFFYFSFG
jgi:hypothetical protein